MEPLNDQEWEFVMLESRSLHTKTKLTLNIVVFCLYCLTNYEGLLSHPAHIKIFFSNYKTYTLNKVSFIKSFYKSVGIKNMTV